jgi:histone acetyltransferase HAC2
MFQNCMDFNQQSPALVSYCKNVETEAMKRLEEARRRDGEMRNEYSRGMKKQCGLCGGGDLTLEGALLHCSGRCMEMIESNHPFYHDVANQYIWCENCYSQLPDTFSFEGKQWKKKELRKGSNSKKDVEAWIQCARCLGHFHRICALYNNRLAEQDPSLVFHCPKCILEMKENCITSPVALYLPRVTGTFNIVT